MQLPVAQNAIVDDPDAITALPSRPEPGLTQSQPDRLIPSSQSPPITRNDHLDVRSEASAATERSTAEVETQTEQMPGSLLRRFKSLTRVSRTVTAQWHRILFMMRKQNLSNERADGISCEGDQAVEENQNCQQDVTPAESTTQPSKQSGINTPEDLKAVSNMQGHTEEDSALEPVDDVEGMQMPKLPDLFSSHSSSIPHVPTITFTPASPPNPDIQSQDSLALASKPSTPVPPSPVKSRPQILPAEPSSLPDVPRRLPIPFSARNRYHINSSLSRDCMARGDTRSDLSRIPALGNISPAPGLTLLESLKLSRPYNARLSASTSEPTAQLGQSRRVLNLARRWRPAPGTGSSRPLDTAAMDWNIRTSTSPTVIEAGAGSSRDGGYSQPGQPIAELIEFYAPVARSATGSDRPNAFMAGPNFSGFYR